MKAAHIFAPIALATGLAIAGLAGCEIVVDDGSGTDDASIATDSGADGSTADGGRVCSAEIGAGAIGATCNTCTKAQCCTPIEACAKDLKDQSQNGNTQCAIYGELLLECAKNNPNDNAKLNACKADADAAFDSAYGNTANNSKFLWQGFIDCATTTCGPSCN
jgi:hypothetical protein